MSNALAIAAVTAVLKDLLDNALIDQSVSGAVGGPVTVTALPPDRIKIGEDETPQLNLFLYHVTPNAGWSNTGLPSRDQRGTRLRNPPLAIDLYYLLTAYGQQDFEGEILLGYAMQMLHETPILTREAIRRTLAPPSPVGGGMLPPALGALVASDLADQVELIKLSPYAMNTEEISKLWTAFQAKYRPSAAYHASVVLIESRRSTQTALPVRARNLYVLPFRQPVIAQLLSQAGAGQPIVADQPILAGYNLIIAGERLRGDITLIQIGPSEVTPTPDQVGDTRISLPVPAGLQAGVQGVQVVHQLLIGTPATVHRGVASNMVAFVLHPTVSATAIAVSSRIVDGVTLFTDDVEVTFNPAVGKQQRVILLLNEFNPPTDRPARAYSFNAPSRNQPGDPETTATLTIRVTDVLSGHYLMRVQVDGAESILGMNMAGQYATPQVTIP